MAKPNYKNIRSEIAVDLRNLADILESKVICGDVQPLRKASMDCLGNKDRKEDEWGYGIERLLFTVPEMEKAHPSDAFDFIVELSGTFGGKCPKNADIVDPLAHLQADVVIHAKRKANQNPLICSWHLDRHISSIAEAQPVAAHPRYHMHHGGNRMTGLSGMEYGSSLLLPSPRLAHPPLDGVLCVDFLLSNFIPERWKTITADNVYRKVVQSSQKKLWMPYARSISAGWGNISSSISWDIQDIWPHLVR